MWYIPIIIESGIDYVISLSSVPISFVGEIGVSKDGEIVIGRCYYTGNLFDSKLQSHIEIRNDLGEHEKIACLLHEISHIKCYKKKCECSKPINKLKAEIHAFTYTLKWLLKYKHKKALKIEMQLIQSYSKGLYYEVAKHIIKSKLWKKCMKYISYWRIL